MNDHDFCRIDYNMTRTNHPAPKFSKGRTYQMPRIHQNQDPWFEVYFQDGSVYRNFADCAWQAKADALEWFMKTPKENRK